MSEISKLESRRDNLLQRKTTIEELEQYAPHKDPDAAIELSEIEEELTEVNGKLYAIESKRRNAEYERSV